VRRHAHPKKEVEEALRYAESQGWRVEIGGNHARALRRVVDNCTVYRRQREVDGEE
jgi:hypothetical protein